jgi:hypothetical protein
MRDKNGRCRNVRSMPQRREDSEVLLQMRRDRRSDVVNE